MGFALSRTEKLFAVAESTYGSLVTPVATDAAAFIRVDPKKIQSFLRRRDKIASRTRPKPIAGGGIRADVDIEAYMIPSGTAATEPDMTDILLNLMGTKTVINTTSTAGSTASVVNVASATGIAKGTILGWNNEMRPVASVAGTVVTMAIAFSGAPANTDPIRAVNYTLANATANSLNIYSYISELPLCAVGVVLGRATFNFVDEILACRISGVGSDVKNSGLAAEPSATLTGDPISRSFGKLYLDTTSYDLLDFTIELDNGDALRQVAVGSQTASGVSRGDRVVTDTFTIYLTDTTKTFYDTARNRTAQSLFAQIGNANGKMVSFWLPTRILQIPDLDKASEEVILSFSSNEAYGTGNDELVVAYG